MKRVILGILTAMFCSGFAMAADIAPRLPSIITNAPVAYNWSGFYIGAHGGYGWGKTQDVSNPGASLLSPEGGYGGFQTGYNYQIGPVVAGIDATASFGKINADWGGANQFDPYFGSDRIKSFGTVKGRLGYAVDRLLPYVTGGFAWGITDHGFGCDAARVIATRGCQNKPGGQKFYTSDSDFVTGYTVGAGVEYAFANNWTVKAEYLYTDFGTNSMNLTDPNYPAKTERNFDTRFHSIIAGINYRF